MKLLHNVQYILDLTHNFLCVGQLLSSGYAVVFGGDACSIMKWSSGEHAINIKRMDSNMFPLELSSIRSANVAVGKLTEPMMWFWHLNHQCLKLLKLKAMVIGFPDIGELDSCDECVFRKHAKNSFPYEAVKSQRPLNDCNVFMGCMWPNSH